MWAAPDHTERLAAIPRETSASVIVGPVSSAPLKLDTSHLLHLLLQVLFAGGRVDLRGTPLSCPRSCATRSSETLAFTG